MSDRNSTPKQNAQFALAIVKSAAISDEAQLAGINAALKSLFPGRAVILVVEDEELGMVRRKQLLDFAESAACRVIFSSRVTLN
jgi:hypothetical protein